jgi:hypothetical protein
MPAVMDFGGLVRVPYVRRVTAFRVFICRIEGKFPVARLAFKQKNFPLDVKLTAYSPFIPLDEDNSSMPVACLTYKLTNTSKVTVEATVALTMLNATEMADERNAKWPNQGGKDSKAMTVYRKGEQCSGLWMTSEKFEKNDWKYGTIAVTTDWPEVTYLPVGCAIGCSRIRPIIFGISSAKTVGSTEQRIK